MSLSINELVKLTMTRMLGTTGARFSFELFMVLVCLNLLSLSPVCIVLVIYIMVASGFTKTCFVFFPETYIVSTSHR